MGVDWLCVILFMCLNVVIPLIRDETWLCKILVMRLKLVISPSSVDAGVLPLDSYGVSWLCMIIVMCWKVVIPQRRDKSWLCKIHVICWQVVIPPSLCQGGNISIYGVIDEFPMWWFFFIRLRHHCIGNMEFFISSLDFHYMIISRESLSIFIIMFSFFIKKLP